MKTSKLIQHSSTGLIVAMLIFSAIQAAKTNSADAAPAAAAGETPVKVARPVVRELSPSGHYPAMIEAVDRVELHAQVSGYLQAIDFEQGSFVRQGDILFRIDAGPYEAELSAAEAELVVAKAEAVLARTERDRADRLLRHKAISVEDAERRIAQADVAIARISEAEARVNAARLRVEFTRIRAPFNGLISHANVTPGNLVSPDDLLAVLVSLDRLYVRFDIDEDSYLKLRQQDAGEWSVSFSIDGRDSPAFTGPVSIVGNEVRPGTGTVSIRAEIANNDRLLLPGMYGQAVFVSGKRQPVVLIDEKAVGTRLGKRYVLIVGEENVVEMRPVIAGKRLDQGLRVIEQGLSEHDRVIVNGLMRVRPGAAVSPQEVPMLDTGSVAAQAFVSGSM